MRHQWIAGAAVAVAVAASVARPMAQNRAAAISFDGDINVVTMPEDTYLGEVAGVATDSKGHIFVYTRTGSAVATLGGSRTFMKGGSRLFEFAPGGAFMREIGSGVYGFSVAEAVRVDAHDNIWVVDEGSTQVIEFDPDGRILLVLGRKPESMAVAPAAGGAAGRAGGAAGANGAGIPGDTFTRTADVAWDAAGNIYVADGTGTGAGDARVAKFDRNGHFLASWGTRGAGPGQFDSLRGIAVDAAGHVYVADAGNTRIQVFSADGRYEREITQIGTPSAICLTPGPTQYLYSSNSNDPDTMDNGEIYKLALDGRIIGRFGRAGKRAGEFGAVNAIDCRRDDTLLVGELLNWRVQRVTLHPLLPGAGRAP